MDKHDETTQQTTGHLAANQAIDVLVSLESALGLLSADGAPAAFEPTTWASASAASDPRMLPVNPEAAPVAWGREILDRALGFLAEHLNDWESATKPVVMDVHDRIASLRDKYPSAGGQVAPEKEWPQISGELIRARINLRVLTAHISSPETRAGVLATTEPLPWLKPHFGEIGESTAASLQETAANLGFGKQLATVEDVREFVRRAHAGQIDKLDRNYYTGHLLPVAAKLTQYGPEAEIAGLLHDTLEDTGITADDLRELGVSEKVLAAVDSVTKREGENYDGLIARSAADPLGCLVKLADNELNLESNALLAKENPEAAARLKTKYTEARKTLLKARDERG